MKEPVCAECGSPDVRITATCRWDNAKQTWVFVAQLEDLAECKECVGDCKLDWVGNANDYQRRHKPHTKLE